MYRIYITMNDYNCTMKDGRRARPRQQSSLKIESWEDGEMGEIVDRWRDRL